MGKKEVARGAGLDGRRARVEERGERERERKEGRTSISLDNPFLHPSSSFSLLPPLLLSRRRSSLPPVLYIPLPLLSLSFSAIPPLGDTLARTLLAIYHPSINSYWDFLPLTHSPAQPFPAAIATGGELRRERFVKRRRYFFSRRVARSSKGINPHR